MAGPPATSPWPHRSSVTAMAGPPATSAWPHRSSVTAMAGPPATSPGPTGARSRPWRNPRQQPWPHELGHAMAGPPTTSPWPQKLSVTPQETPLFGAIARRASGASEKGALPRTPTPRCLDGWIRGGSRKLAASWEQVSQLNKEKFFIKKLAGN
eukprot:gene18951-biopygen17456